MEHSLNGKDNPPLTKVGILSTFTPRECGIATFSADVAKALQDNQPNIEIGVIAMSDQPNYAYGEIVQCEILDDDLSDYSAAAQFINRNGFDVISIQHEYGIFGGSNGSYLLNLVRELQMPVVTTLHTVLREPTPGQREVLDELLQLSQRVVVMSERAQRLLNEVHGLSTDKIDLIHHGVPDIPSEPEAGVLAKMDSPGPILLTFGLLSPDKGIEYAIQAMPKILDHEPNATYFVVGATHPHLRSTSGEAYREKLKDLANELGVAHRVRFVDRFVTKTELNEYLSCMDIYITPYLNAQQISSGTLAYAVGSGKAVISTPYVYAEELLSEGRGVLVPFRDADAIASSIQKLFSDLPETKRMGERASVFGKQMRWPAVGRKYLECFSRARRNASGYLRDIRPSAAVHVRAKEESRPPSISHLVEMTDDTGLFQHATHSIPNRAEGYCVDDNARALLLTVMIENHGSISPEIARLQKRYLSFVQDAFNPETGRFRNFMDYSRHWLEDSGSTDSQARTIWALGAVVGRSRDSSSTLVARQLLENALPGMQNTSSPRTAAYTILGCQEASASDFAPRNADEICLNLAEWLLVQFNDHQHSGWSWFEDSLTYANARLAQAMILAGEQFRRSDFTEAGLDSLRWLMSVQKSSDGTFLPIGSDEFYQRGGTRSIFDQQPIEAWASVSACMSAYEATSDSKWVDEAGRAFRWFLGGNNLGISLINPLNGACCDGLQPNGVNKNQGAESTLSYLCAWYELNAQPKRATRTPDLSISYEIN